MSKNNLRLKQVIIAELIDGGVLTTSELAESINESNHRIGQAMRWLFVQGLVRVDHWKNRPYRSGTKEAAWAIHPDPGRISIEFWPKGITPEDFIWMIKYGRQVKKKRARRRAA